MATTQTENMEKQPIDTYFCKKHMGVMVKTTRGGEVLGHLCSEGGEMLTPDSVVDGIAWVFTWADFGLEDDPFD